MCVEVKYFMIYVSQQEPYIRSSQQWIWGTATKHKGSKNSKWV